MKINYKNLMKIIDTKEKLIELLKPDTYKLNKILMELMNISIEDINSAKKWDDLGMDDLDFVEFIMSIESLFDVAIHDDVSDSVQGMLFIDFYNLVNLQKIRSKKLEQLGI